MAGDTTHGHDSEQEPGRTTAPMSEFAVRDAAFGFVVMVIGVALVFGIPLAFF